MYKSVFWCGWHFVRDVHYSHGYLGFYQTSDHNIVYHLSCMYSCTPRNSWNMMDLIRDITIHTWDFQSVQIHLNSCQVVFPLLCSRTDKLNSTHRFYKRVKWDNCVDDGINTRKFGKTIQHRLPPLVVIKRETTARGN